MAKYQGRRMVKNDLIAQIGQGGAEPHLYVYNFILSDTNNDDCYLSIFSSKVFNNVLELVEWWETIDSYEFTGFITNSQYNSQMISNFNYANVGHHLEVYSMYDNEIIIELQEPDESSRFIKVTQIF